MSVIDPLRTLEADVLRSSRPDDTQQTHLLKFPRRKRPPWAVSWRKLRQVPAYRSELPGIGKASSRIWHVSLLASVAVHNMTAQARRGVVEAFVQH